MKLPYNWIKEYTNIDADVDSYVKNMIMTGTAIDGYSKAAPFTNVVVGKVLSCVDHENSDHLHVCMVDVGSETLQIVCGAPNVKSDIFVAVALVGAELPGGIKIKKGKLRGVDSYGMLCSSTELEIPNYLYPSVGEAGILVFNEEYPLGSDVANILHLNDEILEFDILANRPDCLSVMGIAIESAAVLDKKFTSPKNDVHVCSENINDFVSVEIKSNACPRYMARMIKNVKIAASPIWLRAYLHKAGIRSINNIVDITNFVMLETGHPMHAFDYDKLRGKKIIVRNASEGEKLTTLDEKVHTLNSNDLTICDAEGATGLAGIMGGFESEIDENTKRVVFECAVFDKGITRKTSRRLGIRTESSGRFEKGVCEHTVPYAINRACHLVNQLNAGDVLSGTIDIYNKKSEIFPIITSIDYINKRSGVNVPLEKAINILERLGFTCANSNGTITVVPPKHRQDIEQEADICEEVLRLYGFDHIPSTPLRGVTTQGLINKNMAFRNMISEFLTGYGFSEAMHYSFISLKMLEKLQIDKDDIRMQPIAILNPLGEDSAYMRTTLIPSLLQTAALNLNRGNNNLRLFESSNVFYKSPQSSEGLPYEENSIAMICYGDKEDFYSIRVVCEAILEKLEIKYSIQREDESYLHPGRSAALIHDEKKLIKIGQLHPSVAESFGIDKNVFIAEINIPLLMQCSEELQSIKDLPKYPAVTRDIAEVFTEDTLIGPVMDEIKKISGKLLEDISVFDVYRGKPIDKGFKSVAFSFIFRSPDKTLSDDEIQELMNKIISTLKEKYDANIRE